MRLGSWRDAFRAGVVGVGCVVGSTMLLISLDRRTYFFSNAADRETWQHPTAQLVLFLIFTALETAVAFFGLDPARETRIWLRALSALALLAPWAFALSMAIVHAPGFYLLHVVWLWGLVVTLASAALASGAGAAATLIMKRVGERRGRPTTGIWTPPVK